MFLRQTWLKKFVGSALASGCVLQTATYHASGKQSIFQFEALDIDGNPRKLSDYQGMGTFSFTRSHS